MHRFQESWLCYSNIYEIAMILSYQKYYKITAVIRKKPRPTNTITSKDRLIITQAKQNTTY